MPTILFLPILYLVGWLFAQPFFFFSFGFEANDVALLGTVFTFICFLICLPSWIKFRWRKTDPWNQLGIIQSSARVWFKDFLRGFLWSLLMIFILVLTFLVGGWCEWVGVFDSGNLLNAVLLGIGVGFAEELVFRGWLWGEINYLIGSRWSIFIQAAIFSLSHIRFKLGFFELMALLTGLFLLGILLSLRRILDKGSLVGAIGLHGGLVGSWFLINSDLIHISLHAPAWITGPGGENPNPIGGIVAISALCIILFFYRTAFAIAGLPFRGERNASSKGAIP